MFFAFLIFDPKWGFCKGYSLCLAAIFDNFQNAFIFRILAVFWSCFFHRTTAMCCRNVFSMFFAFLIFDPKWGFCKGYSLCLAAIFDNFQNAFIFRILAVFWSCFFHITTAMCCRNLFSMFFAFLIFHPNWGFCKDYCFSLVAIFGNFQNALIFRIRALFGSSFFHRPTSKFCRNVFIMLFCIFNFSPKVRLFQRL